jgi:hypothetical protein
VRQAFLTLRFNQVLSTVELCPQVACPAGGLAHAHGRLPVDQRPVAQ